MIELEDRLRHDLHALAGDAPSAPDLYGRALDRIRRRRRRAVAQRAGAAIATAGLATMLLAAAVTNGGGAAVTDLANATPRTGDPGWATLAPPLIEPRFQHASVAIDGEVLVFGGYDQDSHEASGAAMYDPDTGQWRLVADPPGDMHNPAVVSTGTGAFVLDLDGRLFFYDAPNDAWHEYARSPFQTGANGVSRLAWTGEALLAIQTGDADQPSPPLASFDPQTDTWTQDDEPVPARSIRTFAWTGTELLVADFAASGKGVQQTALWSHSPAAGWRTLPAPPLDRWEARYGTYAIWTGSELVVGGGVAQTEEAVELTGRIFGTTRELTAEEEHILQPVPMTDAAAWDPVASSWRTLPDAPVSSLGRSFRYEDLWTGQEIVTWIPRAPDSARDAGAMALLDPAAGTWRIVEPPPIGGQQEAPAVWTGHEIVIVSGEPTAGDASQTGCCEPVAVAVAFTP